MFRKFTKEENIKTSSAVRSSEQRQIRAQIVQQYPALEPYVEDLFPKKGDLIMTAPGAPFLRGKAVEPLICTRSCFMLEPAGAALAAETDLDDFVAAEAAHWTATLTRPSRRSSTVGCMARLQKV